MKLFLVFLGGGIGAALRYIVSLASVRLFGIAFPWGTLIVNLTGCFLIGIIYSFAEYKGIISPSVRLFFITGFLGGLTTFSSFGMESMALATTGDNIRALSNILANNIGGFAMVICGMMAGKLR